MDIQHSAFQHILEFTVLENPKQFCEYLAYEKNISPTSPHTIQLTSSVDCFHFYQLVLRKTSPTGLTNFHNLKFTFGTKTVYIPFSLCYVTTLDDTTLLLDIHYNLQQNSYPREIIEQMNGQIELENSVNIDNYDIIYYIKKFSLQLPQLGIPRDFYEMWYQYTSTGKNQYTIQFDNNLTNQARLITIGFYVHFNQTTDTIPDFQSVSMLVGAGLPYFSWDKTYIQIFARKINDKTWFIPFILKDMEYQIEKGYYSQNCKVIVDVLNCYDFALSFLVKNRVTYDQVDDGSGGTINSATFLYDPSQYNITVT